MDDNAQIINKRYDFLYIFDVKDGNPNGDPDFANAPRFDPETFQGIVSDVCVKRKIRDYVYAANSSGGTLNPGYDVFVLQGQSLESRQKMPYEQLELKAKSKDLSDIEAARAWMCQNFFDVRAFGAVMSTTDFNCGQVRGPVQLTFARSFDRILSSEHGITRLSHTTQKDQDAKGPTGTMGNKHTVAYGLYCAHGFVNPCFADNSETTDGRRRPGTGFTTADLEWLFKALVNMLGAFDASAARGLMAARHLFVFEHSSALGEAPAHKLFELVENGIARKEGVESPRAYADYTVPSVAEIQSGIDELGLDGKVTVTDIVNP